MFFSIILLFSMLVCIILFRKNKIFRTIYMYYIIISAMFVVAIIYVSKTTAYTYTTSIGFPIYNILLMTPIPIKYLSFLYNLLIASYMWVGILFIRNYVNLRWFTLILMVIPLLGFLFWNSFYFTQWMYVKTVTTPALQIAGFNNINSYISALNNFLLLIYVALPVFFIVREIIITDSFVKRRNEIKVLFLLILLNAFSYYVFLNIFDCIYVNNVNIAKLPINTENFDLNFMAEFISFVTFFFAFSVVGIMFLSNLSFGFSKKKFIKNSQKITKNVYVDFHTYKNVFLLIFYHIDIIKKNINIEQYDAVKKHLDITQDIVSNHIKHLTNSLKISSDTRLLCQTINLAECLQNVINGMAIPKDIEIKTDIENDVFIEGNEYHFKELFLNLLKNSVEAINEGKKEKPCIQVELFKEKNFAVFKLIDNGCGIEKKNLSKVFDVFFSTKQKNNNGVGLSYVKDIVELHNGELYLRSKKGLFTLFEIVVPCMCGGEADYE